MAKIVKKHCFLQYFLNIAVWRLRVLGSGCLSISEHTTSACQKQCWRQLMAWIVVNLVVPNGCENHAKIGFGCRKLSDRGFCCLGKVSGVIFGSLGPPPWEIRGPKLVFLIALKRPSHRDQFFLSLRQVFRIIFC